jgi:hypothetical protein
MGNFWYTVQQCIVGPRDGKDIDQKTKNKETK